MEDTATLEVSAQPEFGPMTDAALELGDQHSPGTKDLLLNLFGAMKKSGGVLPAMGIMFETGRAQVAGNPYGEQLMTGMPDMTEIANLDQETAQRYILGGLLAIGGVVKGTADVTNKDWSPGTKAISPVIKGGIGGFLGYFSPEIIEAGVKLVQALN